MSGADTELQQQQQHQGADVVSPSAAAFGDDPDGAAAASGHDDGSVRGGRSWLSRVFRAAVPVQTLGFLLLGAAAFLPLCCDDWAQPNGFIYSLQPVLRYYDGMPPL